MRIQSLILSLILCFTSAFAQDIITKTDGTKLDTKVEEITATVIKYRKASNPSGPIYSINVESVASIEYSNGDVDVFNKSAVSKDTYTGSQKLPSDEDLIRMYRTQESSSSSIEASDIQLLKMVNGYRDPGKLIKKAKNFRIIGWIGGAALLAGGVVPMIILLADYYNEDTVGPWLIGGAGLIGGAAWCIGFNMKANSLMREAQEIQSYSINLIENDVLKFGKNTLVCGINLMGNHITKSHNIGFSMALNF